jgi:NAD(P)H-hydrate epimerase
MNQLTIDEKFLAGRIPPRRRDSHKGMNGVVCVVGGSRVYHGAPFLTAMAAMRTGVDLVYLAVPGLIAAAVRALSPDLIVVPLADGKLTTGSVTRLVNWLPQVNSIAVGPGLGPQDEERLTRCLAILSQKAKRMVVDADALRPGVLSLAKSVEMVVTPHAGEFERLFTTKLPPDTDSRAHAVLKHASEHGVTVLLKGPTDIVSDGASVAINRTHSPSMTVGGTGDVLTGITAGLVSKGMGTFDAACCAVHINGLAGVSATEVLGLHITASDVVAEIPKVMKAYDRLE